MKAKPPKYCPDCRQQKRLAFWPFAKFNKRKCDLSGESIISIYPSSAHFPVYKSSNWNSDAWEPPFLDYDASRNFLNSFMNCKKNLLSLINLGPIIKIAIIATMSGIQKIAISAVLWAVAKIFHIHIGC